MKLVIAEKPSVAQSIAAVLGARQRGDGYLEGNGYLGCGEFAVDSNKLKERSAAEQMASACKGQNAKINRVIRTEAQEKPPALYDLAALQRDANRLLGYTAQQTPNYLQSLYEKKLCTYRG